ncbi:hypothetical protein M426DRAFT_162442 [Hypoxylon sp. CI-4A]|nr:hypothetical protein M426DRAFT_162442 [Hypoxylon sp. CI-4A]
MAQAEDIGEGSGRSRATTMTLGDAMRAPSINPPRVIVLDTMHGVGNREEAVNPKEDLWLTSADGYRRYNSSIIPLRVGTTPDIQTFYVHKNVLLKADFFKKALCGDFRESEAQAVELPEEDPAIFHFVVAFLYENKYVPIQAAATLLGKLLALRMTNQFSNKKKPASDDKVKDRNREENEHAFSDSDDSDASGSSDSTTARSQRLANRRRRRENRVWERERRKRPGRHRPDCSCQPCLRARGGPPCWNCLAPRMPPPPPPPLGPLPPGIAFFDVEPPRRRNRRRRHNRHRPASPLPTGGNSNNNNNNTTNNGPGNNNTNNNEESRIQGQDLQTWLLAYELNLDVYICAHKFLLADFKRAVARATVDQLESAGSSAAHARVLHLCQKLYAGLPETDPLLRMVFARVGFLSPGLWRGEPAGTAEFFHEHPEVAALMFRETVVRREEEEEEEKVVDGSAARGEGDRLPAMELERPEVLPFGGMPPPPPTRLLGGPLLPGDLGVYGRGQRWRGDPY